MTVDSYLFVGPVEVHDANAEANMLVASCISPTAATGMMHAWSRRLHEAGLPVVFETVAVIVHEYEISEGHPKFAPSRSDMNRETPKEGASVMDEIRMRFRASFALGVDTSRLGEDYLRFGEEIGPLLSGIIPGSRIAGGTCVSVGKNTVDRTARMASYGGKGRSEERPASTDFVVPCKNLDDVMKAVNSVRSSGWMLKDRVDLLQNAADSGRDPLDVVLDALEVSKKDDDTWSRAQEGWIVPVAVGYLALETPRPAGERSVGRAEGRVPHAFVENMVGLGEYVSVRRLTADALKSGFFWRYERDLECGAYYRTAV